MRSRGLGGSLLVGAWFVTSGCAGEPSPTDQPCEVPEVEVASENTVIVGDEPLCRLAFAEVVSLEGTEGTPLPRPPIVVTADGRYVTATYDPGRLALWSPSGEFLRPIGEGSGDGPGEFEYADELVLHGDTLVLFGSRTLRVHRYTLSGEFIDTKQMPLGGNGAVLPDGTPIVSMVRHDRLMVLGPDEPTPLGPPRSAPSYSSHISVARDRIWEGEGHKYEIRHYPIDDDEQSWTVDREVAWFTDATEEDLRLGSFFHHMKGLAVEESGLIWARLQVPDIDGEPLPDATQHEAVTMEKEDWWRYVDGRIEVLTPSGELIASERFDDPLLTPIPISPRRWYVVDESDPRAPLSILEAVLVSHEGPG